MAASAALIHHSFDIYDHDSLIKAMWFLFPLKVWLDLEWGWLLVLIACGEHYSANILLFFFFVYEMYIVFVKLFFCFYNTLKLRFLAPSPPTKSARKPVPCIYIWAPNEQYFVWHILLFCGVAARKPWAHQFSWYSYFQFTQLHCQFLKIREEGSQPECVTLPCPCGLHC